MLGFGPIERALSILCSFSVLMVSISLGALIMIAGVMGLRLGGDPSSWGIFAGGACCMLAGLLLFYPALLWVLYDSRTGKAAPLLHDVAARLGAQASIGSLLLPMVSPRLTRSEGGRPFRLMLMRKAGVLSPRTPGRARLVLFDWVLVIQMDATLPVRLGFAREATTNTGASLLGLSGFEQMGGLTIWASSAPEGQHIAGDPAVQEAAQAALAPAFLKQPVLRIGPTHIDLTVQLNDELTADNLTAWVNTLAAMADACEAAQDQHATP